MKNNKSIMLSGRKYPIKDMGEGQPCLLLIHQHCQAALPLSMLIKQIRDNYRLIILDITDHLPADPALISEAKLMRLIDDLHLLCDIYWLKKVIVRSDYQPDLIQSKFQEMLSGRYQSDVCLYQLKEALAQVH